MTQSRSLRRVRPGDPIGSIGARGFNAIIDKINSIERNQKSVDLRVAAPAGKGGVYLVRNFSFHDLERREVIGLDLAHKLPHGTYKSDEDLTTIPFAGISPSRDGAFGIAVEPIVDIAVGLVAVSGLVRTRVDFGSEGPMPRAQPIDDDFTKLRAGTTGAAEIIESDGTSGVVDAIVRLGSRATTRVEARIHTPVALGMAGDHRWTYSATIGAFDEDGDWADGPVTVAARNREEVLHTASGIQSSGVNTANLVGTYAHVATGTAIRAIEGPYKAGVAPFFYFRAASQQDGACS